MHLRVNGVSLGLVLPPCRYKPIHLAGTGRTWACDLGRWGRRGSIQGTGEKYGVGGKYVTGLERWHCGGEIGSF